MPRDLLADKALESMSQLSRKPAVASPPEQSKSNPHGTSLVLVEDRFKNMTKIHPFSSLLSVDDLDDCDWLEHAAFDPIEAASREKVSELSLPLSSRMQFGGLCILPVLAFRFLLIVYRRFRYQTSRPLSRVVSPRVTISLSAQCALALLLAYRPIFAATVSPLPGQPVTL